MRSELFDAWTKAHCEEVEAEHRFYEAAMTCARGLSTEPYEHLRLVMREKHACSDRLLGLLLRDWASRAS